MPGAPFHDQQARHNEEFYGEVDRKRFPDWATTALFYAAVHVWGAYTAEVHGLSEQDSHRETEHEMACDPRVTPEAFAAYKTLAHRAHTARYLKWTALPQITDVDTESRPLYDTFRDWAQAARTSE